MVSNFLQKMKNRAVSGAVSEFFRSQPSLAKATAGFSSPLLLCEVASLRSTSTPAAAYPAEAATSAAKAGSREVFWRRRIKLPLILVILGVITLGFACAGATKHGFMHNSGMSPVVMTSANNQECCNTSISKHFGQWKDTLLVVPREMRDGLFLLILGLIATLAVGLFRLREPFSDYYLPSSRLYERDNPNLALFNHLKLAFARGLLNPKIY